MIPRLTIMNSTLCDPEWEAEGRCIQIIWLGFVFEFALARIDR